MVKFISCCTRHTFIGCVLSTCKEVGMVRFLSAKSGVCAGNNLVGVSYLWIFLRDDAVMHVCVCVRVH